MQTAFMEHAGTEITCPDRHISTIFVTMGSCVSFAFGDNDAVRGGVLHDRILGPLSP